VKLVQEDPSGCRALRVGGEECMLSTVPKVATCVGAADAPRCAQLACTRPLAGSAAEPDARQGPHHAPATAPPCADSKLLLLIRHGQAVSNWLQAELGPDEWFTTESKCVRLNVFSQPLNVGTNVGF